MALLVQKFGGTSLGDIDRIRSVAHRIKTAYDNGHQLVVVLSAMSKTTDQLLQMAHNLNSHPYSRETSRELDMLLSSGEQVSIALMAMTLSHLNVPAISLTGGQAGIFTVGYHAEARIERIDTNCIKKLLRANKVCLVAGFQGSNENGDIFTLGRGGSDTSAVALAVAMQTSQCEIFTDVDGVYTADPNKVPAAKRLEKVTYEEMLELARLGAGVLHSRSAELAARYNITLHIRSSFTNVPGTLVVAEEQLKEERKKEEGKKEKREQQKAASPLEAPLVRGISLKTDEARISVIDIPDRPGLAADLFGHLADLGVNVDMIVQSSGQADRNTISFTVLQNSLAESQAIMQEFIQRQGSGRLEVIPQVAIVSAVGVGMKSHSGIAAKMFQALAKIDANIEMISTSEIKISVVVELNQGNRALQAVHTAFGLDRE